MLPNQIAADAGRPYADRVKASTRSLRGLQDFTLYNFEFSWGAVKCGGKSFEPTTVEAIPDYTRDAYTLYFKDELGDELAMVALPLDTLRHRLDACSHTGISEHHHGSQLVKRDLREQLKVNGMQVPERLLHELFVGLERHAANASPARVSAGISR